MEKEVKRILVLLMNGVEEMEAVTPVDLLRRSGADVLTASVEKDLSVTGRNAITIKADTHLSTVPDADFDLVIVPGGPGHTALLQSVEVMELLQKHSARGSLTGAICAAPTVLQKAGLLKSRKHTAHFTVKTQLPDIDLTQKVVIDGKIVTSQGAGTAIEFSLALIGILYGKEKANEIARSICFG